MESTTAAAAIPSGIGLRASASIGNIHRIKTKTFIPF